MMLALSDITREVDHAFMLLGVASLILLAGITIAMIVFAVRFRRSARQTTRQFHGHTGLEIMWTVIPTIIVTWMFFVGFKGFLMMRNVPDGAMVVEVTGKQWMWSFHYPEEKLDTVEMVVPVNTPVKVTLTAPPGDVVHSFYIPDFRVKEDAVPAMETFLWFESERVGLYDIFCAEFCGKDHSDMITKLRVVSQKDYDAWVEGEHAKRYKPLVFEAVINPKHPEFGPDRLNIDSDALYKTFCLSCHGENGDGSGLPGVARNFTQSTDWKKTTKVADIYRTLTEGIDGTQMRPYPNLTPWERIALAHRVRSLNQAKLPPDTEADYAALVKEYELDKIKTPGETIPVERAIEILGDEAMIGRKGMEN